jgi:hypothetical protein
MQYIIVWPCCIGYTSKAERLTYFIMNTCWQLGWEWKQEKPERRGKLQVKPRVCQSRSALHLGAGRCLAESLLRAEPQELGKDWSRVLPDQLIEVGVRYLLGAVRGFGQGQ